MPPFCYKLPVNSLVPLQFSYSERELVAPAVYAAGFSGLFQRSGITGGFDRQRYLQKESEKLSGIGQDGLPHSAMKYQCKNQ